MHSKHIQPLALAAVLAGEELVDHTTGSRTAEVAERGTKPVQSAPESSQGIVPVDLGVRACARERNFSIGDLMSYDILQHLPVF